MKAFKELMNEKVEKSTGDLKKACWKGYTAVGMKMKNGRKVPNCVPEEVELQEIDRSAQQPGKDGWSSTDDSAHRPNITANKNLTHKEVSKFAKKILDGLDKKKVEEGVELDESGFMMAAAASAANQPRKDTDKESEKRHAERQAEKYLHMPGKNAAKSRKYWAKKVNKLHGIPEEIEQVDEEAKLSPEAGKNVVPPKAGALVGGGIVKEEEGENKPLGKVMRANDGKKKFKVYVKNSKGNVVKVGFGDPNMEIKRDDPERRKNFRARHNCASATDRTTPRYWSCKNWSKKPVSDIAK